MSKKTIFLILGSLVMLALLAACSSEPEVVEVTRVVEIAGEEVVVTAVVETEVTRVIEQEVEVTRVIEPTPVPRPESDVKVVLFNTQETDSDSVAVYQNIVSEFHELNPDVFVDLVVTNNPDTMGQRMVAADAVGADMGIVAINTVEFAEFVDAGLLYPLDEAVDAIGRDKFNPGALVYGPDGKVYAMAYNGGAYTSLWTRTDLLEEAGLEEPQNFEEILAMVEALTQDTDGDGEIDIYGTGLPASGTPMTGYVLMGMLYENCADFFDRQGNVVFDHPNALEAIKKYAALLEYAPEAASAWTWGDVINALIAGQTATGWYAGRLGWNVYRADPELRANIKPIHFSAGDIPSGFSAYDYLEVYSGVQEPEATMKFLEYLMTGDRMTRFLLTVPGHLAPVTKGVTEELLQDESEYVQLYGDEIAQIFDEMAIGANGTIMMGHMDPETCEQNFNLNPVPWGSQVFGPENIPGEVIHKIFVGEMTPEEAQQWGADRMREIAEEWKAENPDWTPPDS